MKTLLKGILLFCFLLFLTPQVYTQVILDGYVTDAQTKEPLQGIKVRADIYENGSIYLGTYGPILTDFQGFYSFNITSVDETEQVVNPKITYLSQAQFIINQKGNHRLKISILDILGQAKTIIEKDFTDVANIKLDLMEFASGLYFVKTEIGKDVYLNKLLKTGLYYSWGNLSFITKTQKSLNKVDAIGAVMDFIDTTDIHHDYRSGVGDFSNNTPRRSLALPKVVYLPDSMQFTDPEVNYPINTVIRLWQYMCRIIDQDDYKSLGTTLMPMKIYIDTLNSPTGWKEAIRNGINIIRTKTTTIPDSLVLETPEYRGISFENGFSQINISYVDSTVLGQQDHLGYFYYSSTHDAFCGMDVQINTSTNQQPIDIYKAIQRQIQIYITGGIWSIDNPKYMGRNGVRGIPYEPTTPEMQIIDIARNMYDVIDENGGARVFINRFLHPGTLVINKPLSLPTTKDEILKRFSNAPGIKIKVID